jgi:hypothetical protein
MTDDAMVYWSMLATGSQFESKNVLQSANKILLLHPDVFIYTVVCCRVIRYQPMHTKNQLIYGQGGRFSPLNAIFNRHSTALRAVTLFMY